MDSIRLHSAPPDSGIIRAGRTASDPAIAAHAAKVVAGLPPVSPAVLERVALILRPSHRIAA